MTSPCSRQRRFLLRRIGPALLWAVGAGCACVAQPPEPGEVAVVIYNSRMAESKAVADHYALKRGVPASQVVGFALPTREEITRTEFKLLLQEPLFSRSLIGW